MHKSLAQYRRKWNTCYIVLVLPQLSMTQDFLECWLVTCSFNGLNLWFVQICAVDLFNLLETSCCSNDNCQNFYVIKPSAFSDIEILPIVLTNISGSRKRTWFFVLFRWILITDHMYKITKCCKLFFIMFSRILKGTTKILIQRNIQRKKLQVNFILM